MITVSNATLVKSTTNTITNCTKLDTRFTRLCLCNKSSLLGLTLNCNQTTFQQLQLISRYTEKISIESLIFVDPPSIPSNTLLFINRTAQIYNLTLTWTHDNHTDKLSIDEKK